MVQAERLACYLSGMVIVFTYLTGNACGLPVGILPDRSPKLGGRDSDCLFRVDSSEREVSCANSH